MESTENITNAFTNEEGTKRNFNGRIQFIEIIKSENKKIKIPCANEEIATRVINGLKRMKTESTISLLS